MGEVGLVLSHIVGGERKRNPGSCDPTLRQKKGEGWGNRMA
jgi:hypothetical protein